MPTLRDTALIESISELHQKFVAADAPATPYCKLTSRRGLCNSRELTYINENTCPVCHGTVHENTQPSDTARLFQKSWAAKLQHESAAPTPKPADPGPTIVISTASTPISGVPGDTDPTRW